MVRFSETKRKELHALRRRYELIDLLMSGGKIIKISAPSKIKKKKKSHNTQCHLCHKYIKNKNRTVRYRQCSSCPRIVCTPCIKNKLNSNWKRLKVWHCDKHLIGTHSTPSLSKNQ